MTLVEEDVESLQEGKALMEGVINYVFTKAAAVARQPDVLYFLDLTVAHTMYAFGDASLGPLEDMCRKLLVVIPIANYGTNTSDGEHWSLLLLQRLSVNAPFDAFRLDSFHDMNQYRCTSFLALLRSCAVCKDHIPQSSTAIDFPSQKNEVDCGCFVCMAALCIAEKLNDYDYSQGGGGVFDASFLSPYNWDVSLFRRNLLEEIRLIRR